VDTAHDRDRAVIRADVVVAADGLPTNRQTGKQEQQHDHGQNYAVSGDPSWKGLSSDVADVNLVLMPA
jgi:hypothetical protein